MDTLWKVACEMQKKDPVDENPDGDEQIVWGRIVKTEETVDDDDWRSVWYHNSTEGNYFGYMAPEEKLSLRTRLRIWLKMLRHRWYNFWAGR